MKYTSRTVRCAGAARHSPSTPWMIPSTSASSRDSPTPPHSVAGTRARMSPPLASNARRYRSTLPRLLGPSPFPAARPASEDEDREDREDRYASIARRVRACLGHANNGRISAYRRHASPRSASGTTWKSAIVYPVGSVPSPSARAPGPRCAGWLAHPCCPRMS